MTIVKNKEELDALVETNNRLKDIDGNYHIDTAYACYPAWVDIDFDEDEWCIFYTVVDPSVKLEELYSQIADIEDELKLGST